MPPQRTACRARRDPERLREGARRNDVVLAGRTDEDGLQVVFDRARRHGIRDTEMYLKTKPFYL